MDTNELERKNKSRFRVFVLFMLLNALLIAYIAYQVVIMFK